MTKRMVRANIGNFCLLFNPDSPIYLYVYFGIIKTKLKLNKRKSQKYFSNTKFVFNK